jgi:putative Holliday junction resolvase
MTGPAAGDPPTGSPPGRIMGLDPGRKRIGVALSDESRLIASPLEVINRKAGPAGTEAALDQVARLVEEHGVVEVVCGLPKNMDGSLGQAGRAVMEFARLLQDRLDCPVTLMDERLTSAQARRILIQADVSRAKRKGATDKMAAALILQSKLDADKNLAPGDLSS